MLELFSRGIFLNPMGTMDAIDFLLDKLRSTNRRVYAIGDVAGGLQFTHVAGYHAGLVLRPLLFRLSARENRTINFGQHFGIFLNSPFGNHYHSSSWTS